MSAPTSGTTPRPWYQVDDPNEADAALIVYAVNHIEQAEAALTEALALLGALRRATEAYQPDRLDAAMRLEGVEHDADLFLAAHGAGEEQE